MERRKSGCRWNRTTDPLRVMEERCQLRHASESAPGGARTRDTPISGSCRRRTGTVHPTNRPRDGHGRKDRMAPRGFKRVGCSAKLSYKGK